MPKETYIINRGYIFNWLFFYCQLTVPNKKNPIVFNKGRILLVGQAIEFPKAIKVGQLLPSLKKNSVWLTN